MKRALQLWLMRTFGYLYGRYGPAAKPVEITPPVFDPNSSLVSGTECRSCRNITWWFFEPPQTCPHCGEGV